MKCLSVQNPWSYLICTGIKDVENRSWSTGYRGRLLIHSSGKHFLKNLIYESFPKKFHKELNKIVYEDDAAYVGKASEFKSILNRVIDVVILVNQHNNKSKEPFFLPGCVVGHADLVDVVKNSKSPFAEKGMYHWVLENQVLYKEPIKNIRGKLKLFDLDIDTNRETIKFKKE